MGKQELAQQVAAVQERWDPSFAPVQTEFIPWAQWLTPIIKAKTALVTTGGVYLKKGLHQPFETERAGGDPSFREFPVVVVAEDLELAHSQLDLSFARQDINVLFPLARLAELADSGYIGKVAPFVYSFMGHITRPTDLLSNFGPSVAYRLKRMGAEVALIVAAGGLLDHQTAGLIARSVELAGVPTVVLGTNRAALEAVRPPRAVLVSHPPGAPLGNPGNGAKHQHLLRELFEAAWQFEGAGLIAELPFRWDGQ